MKTIFNEFFQLTPGKSAVVCALVALVCHGVIGTLAVVGLLAIGIYEAGIRAE